MIRWVSLWLGVWLVLGVEHVYEAYSLSIWVPKLFPVFTFFLYPPPPPKKSCFFSFLVTRLYFVFSLPLYLLVLEDTDELNYYSPTTQKQPLIVTFWYIVFWSFSYIWVFYFYLLMITLNWKFCMLPFFVNFIYLTRIEYLQCAGHCPGYLWERTRSSVGAVVCESSACRWYLKFWSKTAWGRVRSTEQRMQDSAKGTPTCKAGPEAGLRENGPPGKAGQSGGEHPLKRSGPLCHTPPSISVRWGRGLTWSGKLVARMEFHGMERIPAQLECTEEPMI